MEKNKVIELLNKILEHELAGVVRYTHYSFMVFGYARIPIVKWLRDQASESMQHAQQIGEQITALEEHPSLKIAPLLETHKHNIDDILKESLEHEKAQLKLYHSLLEYAADQHVSLEEFTRHMIREEQEHINEVEKMLRKPS
ncbi:MAG TPA: ferritin-like domain-containing protein [Bdellovibrionota bacterium]|nr:ferritin-like domain-containing protein [Bdellovibrionota bacterium]